jgi:hypothetical protein
MGYKPIYTLKLTLSQINCLYFKIVFPTDALKNND